MSYGVTDSGFVLKRLADIKTEMEDDFKEIFGVGIDLSAEAPFGQMIGIFSERESLIWELAEDVYNSAYPDTAEDISLDNVGSILGISRKGETYSKVNVIMYGDEGTIIESGKKASVDGNPVAVFVNDVDVEIGEAIAEVQRVTFNFGPPATGTFTLTYSGQTTSSLPYNASAATVQAALRALSNISDDLTVSGDTNSFFTITFAGSMSGINQPLISITENLEDGGGDPLFVFTSQITQGQPAQVAASMTSETSGAVLAPPGSLSVIDTPVTGWTSISNPLSAVIGSELETDPEYRIRRSQVLQRSGSGSLEAIRSDVLNINGVEHCEVYENRTLTTDGDGIPGKSFRVVVLGGPDQQIADTIWIDKPAGIEPNGNTTVEVVDSMGYSHSIGFSRPEEIDIFVQVDAETDSETFPIDGEDQIKAAIVAKGALLGVGGTVIASPNLVSSLEGIPGLIGVTIEVSDDDVTYGGTVYLTKFQISLFDEANIEVTIST